METITQVDPNVLVMICMGLMIDIILLILLDVTYQIITLPKSMIICGLNGINSLYQVMYMYDLRHKYPITEFVTSVGIWLHTITAILVLCFVLNNIIFSGRDRIKNCQQHE